MTDDLITVKAAARSAGVPPNRLRRWIQKGYLPAQKAAAGPGKTGRPGYLVSRADLAQCLERAGVNPPPPRATPPPVVRGLSGGKICPGCLGEVPAGQGYCWSCRRLV